MRELTLAEKLNHAAGLKKYIDIINKRIAVHQKIIPLTQVGYGTEVENYYFYFDFPYTENATNVDKVNEYFKQNPKVEQTAFNSFYDLQKDGIDGYAIYKYFYDNENTHMYIENIDTNLRLAYDKEYLHHFFHSIHACNFLEFPFNPNMKFELLKNVQPNQEKYTMLILIKLM